MPAISVIVPVYKVEKYIHRCVDSILGQTYEDFELILVDDGSPDNCGAICDAYAARDSRVVVIHQENGGLSAARNAGIDWAFANSDSQWLTFIDSDDWVHSEYLSALLRGAVSCGTMVSKCSYIPVDGKENLPDVSDCNAKAMNVSDAFLLKNSGVCAPAKLYCKAAFASVRFPVGKLHEDLFTTYKLLFQYDTIAVVHEPLYYYWFNSESITKSSWKPQRLDEFEAFDEILAFAEKKRYRSLYQKLIALYMSAIAEQHAAVAKSEILEKALYTKVIRNKMRKVILRNPKAAVSSWSQNQWCFGIAFPSLMNLYWRGRGLLHKITGSKQ